MMQVGNAHISSNPATYLHLLSEGHLVLRLALRSASHPNVFNKKSKKKEKGAYDCSLKNLFKESCALLGDQYIRDDTDTDGALASAYYRMAGLTPPKVLDRILGERGAKEEGVSISGLIRYIKKELLSPEAELDESGIDPLAVPDGEAFTLRILTILEDFSPENVSLLVLRSSALLSCRQGIERVLKVLKERQQSLQIDDDNESSDNIPPPQDALALAIVCLHRGCPDRACAVLSSLGKAGQLAPVLEKHSSLLFEQDEKGGLSELAGVVAEACPEALAEVLSNKSTKGGPEVLAGAVRALREKVAASGTAAEGASTGKALRLLLEKHFAPFLSGKVEEGEGKKDTLLEELKMLVRSYLAGLATEMPMDQQNVEASGGTTGSVSEWEIFGPRLPFLERMSPFASESRKKSSASTSKPPSDGQRMCLIKLQSMLCSKRINPECVLEVRQFLQGCASALGRHSLLALCLPPREATLFLLEVCPQTLLQYAKDKYSADNDWKYLLLLLQRRLLTSQEKSPMRVFYTRILRDALSHLSHTLNLEEFVKVLPPGGGKGEVAVYVTHYLKSCQQIQHANHIRSLIIATGNQLLSTLEL